jgi:hypothetical protein
MADLLFKNYPKVEYDMMGTGLEYETVTNIMNRSKLRDYIKGNSSLFYEYQMQEGDNAEILSFKYYGEVKYYWVILMMNDIADGRFDLGLGYNNFTRYIDNKYPGVTLNVTSISGLVEKGASIVGATSGAEGIVLEWDSTKKQISIQETKGDFVVGEQANTIIITDSGKLESTINFGQSKVGRQQAIHHYEDTTNNIIVDRDAYFELPSNERRIVSNLTYEQEINDEKKNIRILKKEYITKVVKEIELLMNPKKAVV